MKKHRKGKPSGYRFRNWSKYNHGKKECDKIVFMITQNIEHICLATELDKKFPEAPIVFAHKTIEISPQIRDYNHLLLRQTAGFIEGLFDTIGINVINI